ncbi:hypothetical protein CPB84DRAFT_1731199 [Gymnopilus junonius]|uniref:Uncharacterized protein n=1 Tax=Gymnopilus junonius TaxID=109634 RepID=A0A9P5TLF0_GYMJU|nr:hypothetical protein CPB84DRAFT_1731199 [Gymnopilus junonius]
MQCTWPRLARFAFQGVSRQPWPPQFPIRPFPNFNKNSLAPWGHIDSRLLFKAELKARYSLKNKSPRSLARRRCRKPPRPVLPDPSISGPLTSAQIGRAASSAIRFSVRTGNLSDAYDIVNSIRYAAVLHNSTSLPGVSSMKHLKSLALIFPSDVSPRLPSHSLLHGLIRSGMPHKASKLAEQMMATGISVRGKTLEALYSRLAQNSITTQNLTATRKVKQVEQSLSPTALMLETSDILLLRPFMVNNIDTRFAIRLLNMARQSRQRRTHTMFKTLMALCILNGEIIVGSLLFGILLRDWQARELARVVENSTTPSTYETPLPVWNRMKEICNSVDKALAVDRKDDRSQLEFKSSLQALANLAHCLDKRLIPFNNITPLLCSMYNCPRTQDKVWVPGNDGTPRQVEAYVYFHSVIHRLIRSLPLRQPTWRPTEGDMMPTLDPASCSTLVHYSLRHRRSVPLAEKVLYHMRKLRDPPIEPNQTLMNIIERSGKLLSKSEIAKEVVTRFKQSSSSVKDQSTKSRSLKYMALSMASRNLVDIAKTGDNYALSTRMTTLTSSGKPQAVVDAIPFLLPGLLTTSYPQERDGVSHNELTRLRTKIRQEGLRHAVSLGPVILTSILNALQKRGRTGIAEKVWLWAKDAEALSWVATGEGQVKPWCLPVLAYTIMIKVYASEARKRSSGRRKGWGRRRKAKGRKWLLPGSTQVKKNRSQLGRELGLEIYRSMFSAHGNIAKMLEKHRRALDIITIEKRLLEIPQPDARFFNAILDIVGRHQGMSPRKIRRGQAHYSRVVRRARMRFIRLGKMPYLSEPDSALPEVAKDMLAHGFPVPLVYQRLLIGKLDDRRNVTRRMERDRRPFALAVRRSSSGSRGLGKMELTKLPIVKTRSSPSVGLDVG